MEIADRIRDLRKARGWSQGDLAERMANPKFQRVHVAKVETNVNELTSYELRGAFATAFGMSLDAFNSYLAGTMSLEEALQPATARTSRALRIEDVDDDGNVRVRVLDEQLGAVAELSAAHDPRTSTVRVVEMVCSPKRFDASWPLVRAASQISALRYGAPLLVVLSDRPALSAWSIDHLLVDGLRASGEINLLAKDWLPRSWSEPMPWRESAHDFEAREPLLRPGRRQERAAALRALDPSTPIWLYHGTDRKTAERLIRDGISPYGKPYTISMARRARGEVVDYSPGSGIDGGFYVGASPAGVDGYGASILAVRVAVEDIASPPEASTLGVHDAIDALLDDNAVVRRPIPPRDIVLLDDERRRIHDVHHAFVRAAIRRGLSVAPEALLDHPNLTPPRSNPTRAVTRWLRGRGPRSSVEDSTRNRA